MVYPLILKLGPIDIGLMNIFFILGVVLVFWLTFMRAREDHINEEDAFDMVFISLFFGVLGGRLFYIAANPGEFGANFFSYFALVARPGFIFWGAVIGVLLALFWCLRQMKIDFFKFLDMFVWPVVVFQLMVVWGLAFDGSFQGLSQTLSFGSTGFVWQHPIVVYESLFLFFMLFLLRKLSYEYRTYGWYKGKKSEARPGFLALTYLASYSFWRLGLALVKKYPLYLKQLDLVLSALFLFLALLLLILRSDLVNSIGLGKWQEKIKTKKPPAKATIHKFKAGREAK